MKLKHSVLSVPVLALLAGTAWAVQINGHALGDIGDIVREVTHGDLEIPKKSLMVVNEKSITDGSRPLNCVQPFILTFNSDGSVAKNQPLPAVNRQTVFEDEGGVYALRPAIARRTSGDERAVMLHDFGTSSEGFNTSFINIKNDNEKR